MKKALKRLIIARIDNKHKIINDKEKKMNLLATIAYAAGTAPQAGVEAEAQNPLFALLPFVAIVGVIYFLMIRPQKAQQRKHTEMLQSLKKNDEVITQGGIYGTIVNVKLDTFTLRIDAATRIEIGKSFILGKKKNTENQ